MSGAIVGTAAATRRDSPFAAMIAVNIHAWIGAVRLKQDSEKTAKIAGRTARSLASFGATPTLVDTRGSTRPVSTALRIATTPSSRKTAFGVGVRGRTPETRGDGRKRALLSDARAKRGPKRDAALGAETTSRAEALVDLVGTGVLVRGGERRGSHNTPGPNWPPVD